MTRLHIPLRLLLLAPFTSAIPTSSLFSRQSDDDGSICPAAQSACPSSLPSGFCCSTDDRCIPLAGNTTVLCCPKTNKNDCDQINPITCNVEQQNPERNPLAPIKTSVFDVKLETCGDGTCCPYGFSCEDGQICRMNKDQDKKPGEKDEESTTTTTTSSASEPTTSSATDPSGTTGSEESPTSLPSDEDENQDTGGGGGSSGPDTTTIIGGVVGGIAALLALAIILFVCARRRASRKTPTSSPAGTPPPGSSRPSHTRNLSNASGPRGNIISEPIMQQNAYRTDFILKNPATASVASTPQIRNSVHPHISTVRDYDDHQNPFRSPAPSQHDSMISTDNGSSNRNNRPLSARSSSSRLAPIRGMRAPRTPRQQPSCESINVFADPGTVERQNRYSMGTTVSGLMIGLRGDLEPEPLPRHGGGGGSGNRLNVPGTTPRI